MTKKIKTKILSLLTILTLVILIFEIIEQNSIHDFSQTITETLFFKITKNN